MHEAGLSPSSSAEVKNVWKYTSTPSVCLHSMHQDITILPFIISYYKTVIVMIQMNKIITNWKA
jgi:hypothetical protein